MATRRVIPPPGAALGLARLKELMTRCGATRLYLKRLADNDNSKNQIYLGPDLSSLNVLPVSEIIADPQKPERLKAPLSLQWLDSQGRLCLAPGAQLILYPQYPEVRFSGFLRGCDRAPSELLTVREAGRLLFLGVDNVGRVLGFAAGRDSEIAREIDALCLELTDGVFVRLPLDTTVDERAELMKALTRIVRSGWITSKRLDRNGAVLPCNSPNCGGYTLEAELGVKPNGFSEPDFAGWEIKQHAVTHLDRPGSGGPITLMTPEPTGGVYAIQGVEAFIRRFGYADSEVADRFNFGGIHTANGPCAKTGLTLSLVGFDAAKGRITNSLGGLSLLTREGEAAATWPFAGMLAHWNRKHARAAYVPSIFRDAPARQYKYGNIVRLGIGTDFLLFLKAVSRSAVYYDPGIKMEDASTAHPAIKRRSQFRIKSAQVGALYRTLEQVSL